MSPNFSKSLYLFKYVLLIALWKCILLIFIRKKILKFEKDRRMAKNSRVTARPRSGMLDPDLESIPMQIRNTGSSQIHYLFPVNIINIQSIRQMETYEHPSAYSVAKNHLLPGITLMESRDQRVFNVL